MTPPGKDATATNPKEKAPEKPSPFRFSWFTWNQTATSTILGVGRNNIGHEDEEYSWEFTLTPRYYFVDTPMHQAYVTGKVGWQTELTNSNTTTQQRQTLFEDMSLGTGYAYTLYTSADKETKVYPGIGASLIFPTSKASAGQGKHLVTSLSFSPRAVVKILGEKAKGLGMIIAYGSVAWSHLFAASYNAINPDVATAHYIQSSSDSNARMSLSDQTGMKGFDMDRVKLTAGYFFPVFGELYFANSWAITEGYSHDYSANPGCAVTIMTGCATAQSDPNHATRNVHTSFDVSLSYDFFESSLRWAVGYQNDTAQLGEDGQRRSVFYSPASAFYMDIIVMFDGVYKQVDQRVNKNKKAALGPFGRRTGMTF